MHPLAHHRDGGAQRPFAVVGERLATQQDLACLRAPLTGQQPHQGRFAAAGLAQQRQLLTGVQLQGAATQHRLRVAGVAKIEVIDLQCASGGVGLLVTPHGGFCLLQDLVQAACRGEAGGEVLESPRQWHQCLEACQGGKDHQCGNGVGRSTRHSMTGQPEHQGQGPAAQQLHREVGQPAHLGHPGLRGEQRLLGLLQLNQRLGGGGKHLQLGLTIQIVHHPGTQGRFFGNQRLTGATAEEVEHQRQGDHAKQQNGSQGEGEATVEKRQEEDQSGGAEQGRAYGGDQPQVDVVHRIDVGH